MRRAPLRGCTFHVAKFYFFQDERDVGGRGPGWENANCSRRLFGDLGHCIHPVRLISLRSEHSPDCLPTALPNHPRSPNVSQFVFPQLVPIPPTSRSVPGRIHLLQPGESIPAFPSGSFNKEIGRERFDCRAICLAYFSCDEFIIML